MIDTLNFLDFVWAYVNKGWYILPVDGKLPLTIHGLKDASVDPAVIKSWWGPSGRFKDSNVAIRTGSISNLVVLDVDAKHGGWESFKELGFDKSLPKTPMVRTGGGGGHFYFTHKEAQNSAGKIAPGIDIRGGRDGKDGYVVAPPSIHPDTGVAYEWEILPSEVDVADLPEFLLGIIRAANKRSPLDFGPGKRNASMTALAGTMVRAGAPAVTIKAALMALGELREGVEEGEVDHILGQSENWTGALPEMTEVDQAKFIADEYGDKIAYDKNRESWLKWGGRHWELVKEPFSYVIDGADLLQSRFNTTADKIADAEEKEKFMKSHGGWIKTLKSARGVDAVTKLLKSVAGKDYELDRDPLLLGVPNGVVILRPEGAALELGSPDQWVTRTTAVNYVPDAKAPRWEQFIREIFTDRDGNERPELVDYVHRAVGYSITGDTGAQCWFLCLGGGSNGKSTFLDKLRLILGDYAQKMSVKTITARANRRAVDNDLSDLAGARFLHSAEAGSTVQLDSERIKDLVGTDSMIRASRMYKDDTEFMMTGKMWMPNNNEPRSDDLTDGFWRRVRIIPFEQRFTVNDTLPQQLALEHEGILAWCVRGAIEFLQRGLDPPEIVKRQTAEVQAGNDPLGEWFDATFTFLPGAKIEAGKVSELYTAWCVRRGTRENDRYGSRKVQAYVKMKCNGAARHGMNGTDYIGIEEKHEN